MAPEFATCRIHLSVRLSIPRCSACRTLMVVFELSIDGNAPEPRNGEVNSTLEFRGSRIS
jgi:hypothetical protein